MREVTREQVVTCLKTIGILPGDGLLIHSAVQFLGHPIGGIGMYLDAILDVIGQEGTIVVPTFSFSFAQSRRYDPQETPSEGMGVFSEYVRQHPEVRRTFHPMQSVAALGFHAEDLTDRDTLSAFDPGSAFERMLELNFKLLLLGAEARATSMFHYCEQRANVPYRYWKEFPGEIRIRNGWENRTYRMYVRDMEINPELTIDPVVKYLEHHDQWHAIQFNYGKVTTCLLTDFVVAVDIFLNVDPWSLVASYNERSLTVEERRP
jgi:aminoglycoside N3'-acetyltransferase